MGHNVRAFAGPIAALRPFLALARGARAYALTAAADTLVLPVTDDLHDTLHAVYGTGEWLTEGPRLSTGDMAFAATASRGTVLAYVETNYFGGEGEQSAMLWRDGSEVLRPTRMATATARTRPPYLWPVNVALRGLGITALAGQDEFTTFGLGHFRSVEDIMDHAVAMPWNG